MTESNQKPLWHRFPSPFSGRCAWWWQRACIGSLGHSSRNPTPTAAQSWPFLPFYVLCLFALLHLSTCLVICQSSYQTEHTCGGGMSSSVLTSTGPILLPGHIDTSESVLKEVRKKRWQGGREGQSEGDRKQPNPVIATVFVNLCSEMLRHMIKSN